MSIILTESLETGGQFPLDSKVYFKTLAELIDLGTSNQNAFGYYDNMVVSCVETNKRYIWREFQTGETNGELTINFTYPSGSIADGIDYSGRSFNFFELSGGTEYFLGEYLTELALNTAHPTAQTGNYADVNPDGEDVIRYIWDDNDSKWVISGGIKTQKTSELVNDGENSLDGNKFLQNNEVTELALNGLSIQDINGIEQFKITDFIQLQGGTFDIFNKRWVVDPLQQNTFFVKSDGNDLTGELNNANKPFKTLDGAITYYKTVTPQPSSIFYSNYTFEILDGESYEITQTLFRSYSTLISSESIPPVLKIYSIYTCSINVSNPDSANTLVLMHNQVDLTHVGAKLILDLPNSILNLTGVNDVQICSTENGQQQVLDLNVNIINKTTTGNGLGRIGENDITGISKIQVKELNISASGAFIERVDTIENINIGSINIESFCTIINDLNEKEFTFNKINTITEFVLVNNNKGIINHGDIDASLVLTQFRYITGHANQDYDCIINYKNNCIVLGDIFIHGFNSGRARYKLYGNSVYYESSYVFYHEDVPVGGFGIEVNVRSFHCENNFTGGARAAVSVKLVNCYMKIGGYLTRGIVNSIELTPWGASGEEFSVLEVEGTCVIDADVVDGTVVIENLNNIPAQGNSKLNIKGDLLLIKGIIDFTNIDLVKETTLNRY